MMPDDRTDSHPDHDGLRAPHLDGWFCRLCDDEEVIPTTLDDIDPDAIWRASYDSRHFSFEAYGFSEDEARSAMLAALLAHAAEYGLVAPWYDADDITIAERTIGAGYRDGEKVTR